MTLEQVFTLINAGYTKEEISSFTQPAQTVQQAQPAQAVQQAQPAQTVQQAQPAQTVQQTQPAQTVQQAQPLNQPVNAAGTTERLLNIIEELQRSNLKLASGQGSAPSESAEDALLSIIQETKGDKRR